ncbi:MAG: hypothetical protein M1818_005205 [Claussenomyces sp. TS43310]|nr:MAG: hypothetical protein M1818_005205 [Claussenomyces sp. TS43310]
MATVLTTLAVRLSSNSGFTGASLVTLMGFGETLSSMVMYYTQLETSIGAVTRLRTFSRTAKSEENEAEDIIPEPQWPQNGIIEMNNVSASYGIDTPENQPPKLALDEISLKTEPGEKIAVCGRTGSGKSSIIALLLKLLEPVTESRSAIHIDGLELRQIDRGTLRRNIVATSQDAELCESVLKDINLWDLFQGRGGLQASFSSGTLSQGQSQLFSLARAILRRRLRATGRSQIGELHPDGGILLLDEVSSSVDQETASAMEEIIRREFKAYTVIAVAHHLSSIMDYDRVVVMAEGRIIESGNPRTLMDTEGSCFGMLWQSGGNV